MQRMYFSTQAWLLLMVVFAMTAAALAQTPARGAGAPFTPSDQLQQRIKDELSGGKKRLAQKFLSTELRNRDSVSVTPAFTWKLGTIKGSAASTFRSFNQSFILDGKVLHRLIIGPGFNNYSTEAVARFEDFLGDVAFVESVEWDGLLYLVAAYKQGLLQLFTVAQDNKVELRQSIKAFGVPTDAEFFMQDEKLFLVVSAKNGSSMVPVVVYRWYGTQLDEENKHLLIEANAVATFPFQESVIIVVAVGATGSRKAGLEIFRRTSNRLELLGLLPVSDPVALQHFTFRSENYVLVTTANGQIIICWWAGTEMIVWDTLEKEGSVRSIGIGYVNGETFILLAQKTKIDIYRPTAESLQYIASHEFNTEVQSASLYIRDQSMVVLAITESAGVLVPYILELHLDYQPASISHHVLVRDPLLECISNLEQGIQSRGAMLKQMVALRSQLLHPSTESVFKGKLVVKKLKRNEAGVRSLKLNPVVPSKNFVMSATQLRDGISESIETAKSLAGNLRNVVFKSLPATLSGRLITNELHVNLASMDSVTVSRLNGQSFDPKNILTYSKNQELTGNFTADTITVDSLTVGSLNDVQVQDLLKKSEKHQVVTGLEQVDHVKVKKIVMNPYKTVNGIPLRKIVTMKSPDVISVAGTKTFNGLNLQQLVVGLLNNRNFTEWIASLQPPRPSLPPMPNVPTVNTGARNLLHNGDLNLKNLTVHGGINGIPFDDLMATLFLKGLNQKISSDTYFNELHVDNLVTSRVNDVPTSSLLTTTTDQIISGPFAVDSITTPDLHVESVNGLKISRDAAYLNSPHSVSTPVVFQRLQSHELVLPEEAHISGVPIGRRLLNQPKIVYEASVKVKGTLKLTDANFDQANVRINGNVVNYRNLHLHYWTRDSHQYIPSAQAPTELNVKTLKVNTINGHPLEDLVYLSSTRTLQGTWHFPLATISGNLVHAPSALQSPFSVKELSSNIVKTSGEYTVSGVKLFKDGLAVKHLVADYIDNQTVADLFGTNLNKGVDSSYQEIWIGGNLHVLTDLTVGSVNRVNLCDRLSKALLIDRPGRIPAATMSAVSASNINVHTFNGIPFSVIAGGRNKPLMPRVGKVTLKGDVYVPYFHNVMSVNNKKLTHDYLSRVVDKTKSGLIRGAKTFASQLTVHGSFDALDYDGVKLRDLFQNVLYKTQDQTIPARFLMTNVIANDLKAGLVNDINVMNLVSSELMSRQTIEGDILFTNEVDVIGFLSATTFEEGCDLHLVAERLQKLDGRHWASLIVEGDLNWNANLPARVQGLGYYLGSAVTKNAQQIIVGEVVFENLVTVENFISTKDINDVSISGIASDALRKSLPDQVIHGHKIFTNQLQSTSMHVMGNVVSKKVAGLDIAVFNRSLVRVGGDQKVRGKKNFLQGFTADLLKVDGSVNGLTTSFVVNYDMELLPPMHFIGPLEIKRDLYFERANDFELDELLEKRVTLDSPQSIEGRITFTRDLSVEGDMVAPFINNVDLADIVLGDSMEEQIINGVKHFTKGLRVEGPMEVDYLENMLMRYAYNAALFRDENATINGDLIFGNSVTMEADLDVETTVNDVFMADLSRKLRSISARSLAEVRSIARTIEDTNSLLKARGDLSEMLYLEPVLDVSVSFTNTYHAIAMDVGGESYVDVYGWASNAHCGLPIACLCPAQYTIHASSEDLAHITWNTGLKHNSSQRSFTFNVHDPHVTVIVKTSSVSQSQRCRLQSPNRLDEVTMLTWVELDNVKGSNEVLTEISLQIEPTPILGYVSDVKVVTVNRQIYVVLGIAYNADLDTTDLNSVIVRIDRTTKRARIVSEFPTHGVSSLDVLRINGEPHLVVGNSYDTSKRSSEVNLDIYKFIARNEQLQLVKSIPTDGIVSVVSIVQGGDSLIVVAQKQPYAPVMVLKYDSAHNDYHFIQQLNPNTIPTGLGVVYVGQPGLSDAFLGVSTADDQFYLYKFGHIEGFKLVMKMELQGVKGFTTFSVGRKQYLLFTSTESPSMFEIVKQSA